MWYLLIPLFCLLRPINSFPDEGKWDEKLNSVRFITLAT